MYPRRRSARPPILLPEVYFQRIQYEDKMPPSAPVDLHAFGYYRDLTPEIIDPVISKEIEKFMIKFNAEENIFVEKNLRENPIIWFQKTPYSSCSSISSTSKCGESPEGKDSSDSDASSSKYSSDSAPSSSESQNNIDPCSSAHFLSRSVNLQQIKKDPHSSVPITSKHIEIHQKEDQCTSAPSTSKYVEMQPKADPYSSAPSTSKYAETQQKEDPCSSSPNSSKYSESEDSMDPCTSAQFLSRYPDIQPRKKDLLTSQPSSSKDIEMEDKTDPCSSAASSTNHPESQPQKRVRCTRCQMLSKIKKAKFKLRYQFMTLKLEQNASTLQSLRNFIASAEGKLRLRGRSEADLRQLRDAMGIDRVRVENLTEINRQFFKNAEKAKE